MLKILIADDEPLARQSIEVLLSQRDDIGQIKQVNSGNQALVALAGEFFDIVFLDIQMPGATGLEVAKLIPESTSIIFATAYNQHAIEAFDLHAIDYILKPFDDDRFHISVDKAIARSRHPGNTSRHTIKATLSELLKQQEQPAKQKLVLRETGKIRVIDKNSIKFIKGAGNYIEIFLDDDKTILHRETMQSIAGKLDEHRFVRIHKSIIVKCELIVELKPTPKGDYVVKLSSGDELMMSRRNKDKLKDFMR